MGHQGTRLWPNPAANSNRRVTYLLWHNCLLIGQHFQLTSNIQSECLISKYSNTLKIWFWLKVDLQHPISLPTMLNQTISPQVHWLLGECWAFLEITIVTRQQVGRPQLRPNFMWTSVSVKPIQLDNNLWLD